MRTAKVKALSVQSFGKYGTFADMINPKGTKLGRKPIEFFRDMVQLDLGGVDIASFSVCQVGKRPAVIDITEFHTACGEGNLPLDGDILFHVGVATPNGQVPVGKIEVFRIPKGTLVALKPGVWHHAPFAHRSKRVNILVVLPERTYANDCEVYEIPEQSRIKVAGA